MKSLAVAAVAALVLVAGAGADDTSPPQIAYSITAAAGDNGWYTSNVTVAWSVSDPDGPLVSTSGCEAATLIATETAGTTRTCTATSAGGTATITTKTIKIDKTPPTGVAVAAARPPDARGWYNAPVVVAASGSDALSGIASCTSVTYGGPDTASGSVSATCRDTAGNTSAPAGLSLRYDATPPTGVAGSPARGPDAGGWFNHPVQVTFTGTDATSGIARCDAPVYGGPDGEGAAVAGACEDVAGNRGSASVALRYDATAPAVTRLVARADKGFLAVEWRVSADTALVELVRRKAKGAAKNALVFKGRGARFRDTKVAARTAYRYELVARDQAGNVTRRGLRVVAPPKLYAPRAGARARGRPLLAWRPDPRARYYNVQLFRGTTKVLSAWPSKAELRLPRSWRYLGRGHRLTRATYRWVVWPGYGARSANRYGKPVGQSRFRYVP